LPPSPAFTVILASSRNIVTLKIKSPASRIFLLKEQGILIKTLLEPNHQLAYRRINADKSTFASLILEFDQTGSLGKQGKVFSQAYILTCLKLSSALSD
jgi:hypothetical protein